MTLIDLATQLRPIIEQAMTGVDDGTALQSVNLFPPWQTDIAVNVGDRYQYNGTLYKVVQGHTTQTEWTPDKTPALWVSVSLDEWPEFVQPTGSHNAYNSGDKVTFNGERYICTMNGCAYSPSEYPPAWSKQ